MRPTPNPHSLFFHQGSAGTGTSRKTGDQHDAAAGGLPSTDGGAWPPGQATAGTGSPGPTAGRGSQQGGAGRPGGTKRAERARGSTVSGSRSGLCTLDKTTAPKHFAWAWSLQSCLAVCDPMDCSPPGSSVHGNSPGKNIGVGCHALLQGIFLAQGSNLSLMSPALAGGFFTFSITWEASPPPRPAQSTLSTSYSEIYLGWGGMWSFWILTPLAVFGGATLGMLETAGPFPLLSQTKWILSRHNACLQSKALDTRPRAYPLSVASQPRQALLIQHNLSPITVRIRSERRSESHSQHLQGTGGPGTMAKLPGMLLRDSHVSGPALAVSWEVTGAADGGKYRN